MFEFPLLETCADESLCLTTQFAKTNVQCPGCVKKGTSKRYYSKRVSSMCSKHPKLNNLLSRHQKHINYHSINQKWAPDKRIRSLPVPYAETNKLLPLLLTETYV